MSKPSLTNFTSPDKVVVSYTMLELLSKSSEDAASQSGSDDDDDNDDSGSEFSDRTDDGSLDTLYDFCQLDKWGVINKWPGDKPQKRNSRSL